MRLLLRLLGLGLLASVALGAEARVFMAFLADDPEFTWGGTMGIVSVFAVAGAALAVVRWARVTGRSEWWALAATPALVMFLGPGLVLLPVVIGVALALSRRAPWVRLIGILLACFPIAVVVMTEVDQVTHRSIVGLALFLVCGAGLGLGWRAAFLPQVTIVPDHPVTEAAMTARRPLAPARGAWSPDRQR